MGGSEVNVLDTYTYTHTNTRSERDARVTAGRKEAAEEEEEEGGLGTCGPPQDPCGGVVKDRNLRRRIHSIMNAIFGAV